MGIGFPRSAGKRGIAQVPGSRQKEHRALVIGKLQGILRITLVATALGASLLSHAAEAAPHPRQDSAVRKALQRRAAARKASQRRKILVNEALRHRGTRYVWGGASRGGLDCSGLIRYVYKKRFGITLPHSASAQARMGKRIPNRQVKPGDLLFFSTYRRGISHVGIYIGNHKFVHAANRRKGVRVDRLTGYYARRLKMARRL